jgi:methyl-accepting chemotaxis protein
MKLTLGKKLGLGFGVILALMVFSSAMTYLKSGDIKQNENRALDVRFPTLVAARELQRDLNGTANKGREVILATEPVRKEAAKKLFEGAWGAVEKDMAELDEFAPKWAHQSNRDLLAEVKQQLPPLRADQDAAMNYAAGGERDAVVKAGREYSEHVTPANESIKKVIGTMADSFVTLVGQNKEELKVDNHSLNLTMGAITFVALGIGAFVAVSLSRHISASLGSILARAKAIAAGDLTREEMKAQGDDELAELTTAINEMQFSLHRVIQSMRETAEQVASASEELSATSQQITANSEETTAQAQVVAESAGQVNTHLQTLASGAEEMSATIGEIAKNATAAARVSGEAVAAADAANQTVSRLGDSSVEIAKVIEVITSIAQQTNLLALNATIEAARARRARGSR